MKFITIVLVHFGRIALKIYLQLQGLQSINITRFVSLGFSKASGKREIICEQQFSYSMCALFQFHHSFFSRFSKARLESISATRNTKKMSSLITRASVVILCKSVSGHQKGCHCPRRSMRKEWKLGTECNSYLFVSFPQKRNGIVFSSGVNYLHSGGNIQSE